MILTAGVYRPAYSAYLPVSELGENIILLALHVKAWGDPESTARFMLGHDSRTERSTQFTWAEGLANRLNITIGAFRAPRFRVTVSLEAEQSFLDELVRKWARSQLNSVWNTEKG